jgi:hypothetical protein
MGSSISSGLIVGATLGLVSDLSTLTVSVDLWLSSICLARLSRAASSRGWFSLSEALKLIFLTGDSILKESMAVAACTKVY